jgi:hypothetical protein
MICYEKAAFSVQSCRRCSGKQLYPKTLLYEKSYPITVGDDVILMAQSPGGKCSAQLILITSGNTI